MIEEGIDDFIEVTAGAQREGIKPVCCLALQAGREYSTHKELVAGVSHQHVQEVSNMPG